MTRRTGGRRRTSVVVSVLVAALLMGFLPTVVHAAGGSVSYSVAAGAYNNTVRLGPSYLMNSARVVAGPNPSNLSQEDVYVIGLNGTGSAPCSNLTVYRSTDDGASFSLLPPSTVCLPGSTIDAVALANGTIVVAGEGPVIVRSADGGEDWSAPISLGNSTSVTSLYLDPNSSALFVAWTGTAGNSSGPLFVASSADGGGSWSAPQSVLPSDLVAGQAELAVEGESVGIAFLELSTIPLPSPPPSGNNSSTPPPVQAPVEALAAVTSSNGGSSWGAPSVLVPGNLSLLIGGASLAVSSSGVFGIAWVQVNGTASQTGAFAAVSQNGGSSWASPVPVSSGEFPIVPATSFGHTAVFDAAGRLVVTWINSSTDTPFGAQLNVAISGLSLDSYTTSSFALALQGPVGNETQSENLAIDSTGQVFLAWTVLGPPGNSTRFGVFVRTVSGEAIGSLAGAATGTSVELTDPSTAATVGRTLWTGRSFTLAGLAPASYQVWVTVGNRSTLAGTIPILAWGTTSFVARTGSSSAPFPWSLAILGAAGATAGAVAAVMYTRLNRDTVLRQKLRALIFEYIQSEPGASFSEVRDALGLQNGTTSYHLAVLEREGFIRSVARGHRRYFFPINGAVTSREPPLSEIQSSILKTVVTTPGMGLRELSRAVGHEPSSVAYSTRVLVREGLLTSTRSGLHLRFYPVAHPGGSLSPSLGGG